MGTVEPESWPFKPGRPRATIPLRERYRGIKPRCLIREALLAYPGYVDEATRDVPWPAAVRRASQLLGGRSLSSFARSLRHVKLVYRPGEPLEAKAYLAGKHLWHTPASRSSSVRPQ
jgi:hypothetical protein